MGMGDETVPENAVLFGFFAVTLLIISFYSLVVKNDTKGALSILVLSYMFFAISFLLSCMGKEEVD